MDNKRINQILNSKGVINVTYEGEPVWIESADTIDGSARVKNLKTNDNMEVSIYKLME